MIIPYVKLGDILFLLTSIPRSLKILLNIFIMVRYCSLVPQKADSEMQIGVQDIY